jgi:hypothetical protein
MASTPPGQQKRKLDYNIDREVYDNFTKMCSLKGFAPQVELELLMKKYVNNQGKM